MWRYLSNDGGPRDQKPLRMKGLILALLSNFRLATPNLDYGQIYCETCFPGFPNWWITFRNCGTLLGLTGNLKNGSKWLKWLRIISGCVTIWWGTPGISLAKLKLITTKTFRSVVHSKMQRRRLTCHWWHKPLPVWRVRMGEDGWGWVRMG